MKKRFLAVAMTLCLLLSLLPATASASGNIEWKEARVSSYEDLVAALADSSINDIYILPRQTDEYGEPTGAPFSWPDGDVTLDLDWASTTNVYVSNGVWTIPENVTVNLHDALAVAGHPTKESMDGGLLIEGEWNCMTQYAAVSCSLADCASVTVAKSGVMSVAKDVRMKPVSVGDFIINGTFINRGDITIENLTMGDGARIEEVKDPNIRNSYRCVYLGGTISCAGSAVIEGWLNVSDSTTNAVTACLDGNFTLDRLSVEGDDSLEITDGSRVSVNDLRAEADGTDDYPVLSLNGTLVLQDAVSSHTFDGNTEMKIGENGVLEIWNRSGMGAQNSTGKVTGTGTVKLFATQGVRDDGGIYWFDHSCIFKRRGGEGNWPSQVADTVTIWRCWEEEGWCEHDWSDPVTLEPTCSAEGYTYSVCGNCGIERHSDFKEPLPHSDLTAEANNETSLYLSCGSCGSSVIIRLEADTVEYVEGQSAEGAFLDGGVEWLETVPTITYTNNDKPGTATATVTIMGITLTTTFEIEVSCEHEAETPATCTEPAVCGLCGNSYGEPNGHTEGKAAACTEPAWCSVCESFYGEALGHAWDIENDHISHWFACITCGERASEEVTTMLMEEWGVLALYEELCIRYNTRYPLSAHIYANDKSCYICGHEYKSVIVIRNDTEPLIDLLINVRGLPETLEAGEEVSLIAALYADGRLVGMEQKTVTVRSDLSVQQSLELSFGASYAPDRCQVFLLDDLTSAPLTSSQTANID